MVRSMTGYGDASAQVAGVHFFIEVRSLNNKYFKASIRLPEALQSLEAEMESRLRERISRGTVTLTARTTDTSESAAYEINTKALARYLDQLKALPQVKSGEMRLDAHLSLEGAVDDFDRGAVDEYDPEVTLPREKRFVEPSYTSGALKRQVSGLVYVEAVVMPDGTVGRARIVHSLDQELDIQALNAVRRWTFVPAQRGGQPVAFVVQLEVQFRVH